MKLVYKGHPPVQIDKGKFTVLANGQITEKLILS